MYIYIYIYIFLLGHYTVADFLTLVLLYYLSYSGLKLMKLMKMSDERPITFHKIYSEAIISSRKVL